MIEYLYKKGHRRIGIIGGKPNLSRPSLARLAGCQCYAAPWSAV